MTTTMVRRARERRVAGARGAFTLAEVIVSTALGGLALAGVLAAFLFFCRAGVGLAHYNDMEAQGRELLQRFGRDARQAGAAAWTGANSLTLTVDDRAVTYAYDAARRRFTRTPAGGATEVMATGVQGFRFSAYDLDGTELTLAGAAGAADGPTKMVQVDMDLARQSAGATGATAQAVSARYVLRNKPTT